MEIGARRLSVKPGSLVAFSNTPPGSERGSSKASKLKYVQLHLKVKSFQLIASQIWIPVEL